MVRYNEIVESVDKQHIREVFEQYFDYKGWTEIHDNGLMSINGSVFIKGNIKLDLLPVKFYAITGNVRWNDVGLSSLIGSPQFCGGNFYCAGNKLTSLEGSPRSIMGSFICGSNSVHSLVGGPIGVAKNYNCIDNQLISLEGIATNVETSIACGRNNLQSFIGLPENFTGSISFDWHENLPLLRLLKCEEINVGRNQKVQKILSKYNNPFSRSNVLKCQKELIDAGYEGNASW
jgi:hypothetical protein